MNASTCNGGVHVRLERQAAQLGERPALGPVLLVHRLDPCRSPRIDVRQHRAEHRLLVLEMTQEGILEGVEARPEPTEAPRDSPRHLSHCRLDLLEDVTEDRVLVEHEAADLTRAELHECSSSGPHSLRPPGCPEPRDAPLARRTSPVRTPPRAMPEACANEALLSVRGSARGNGRRRVPTELWRGTGHRGRPPASIDRGVEDHHGRAAGALALLPQGEARVDAEVVPPLHGSMPVW
jgi:hypothetical protein